MDGFAILDRLEEQGLRVTLNGTNVNVSPKSAITAESRELTRANRQRIVQALRRRGELASLIDRVVEHYKCTPDEVGTIRRIAFADPESAWACFTLTSAAEGIQ